MKKIMILMAMFMVIFAHVYIYGQDTDDADVPITNEVMIQLLGSLQTNNDVIVTTSRYYGFQTRITDVSEKYIHYVVAKKRGEKAKKISQKKVAFTISFNEEAKQGLYPSEMPVNEILYLPVYMNLFWGWTVFGTGADNLALVAEAYPDIPKDFNKGVKQIRVASGMYGISYLLGGIPLIIVGAIVESSGNKKLYRSFNNYYNNCFDVDTCAKYGIVITPYKTSLPFKKSTEETSP